MVLLAKGAYKTAFANATILMEEEPSKSKVPSFWSQLLYMLIEKQP